MSTIISRDGASVEFGPGAWIDRAARDLLDLAYSENQQLRGEFNGVALTASPGESVTLILSRYSADRVAVQAPAGRERLAMERAAEELRIIHQHELNDLYQKHLARIVEAEGR